MSPCMVHYGSMLFLRAMWASFMLLAGGIPLSSSIYAGCWKIHLKPMGSHGYGAAGTPTKSTTRQEHEQAVHRGIAAPKTESRDATW